MFIDQATIQVHAGKGGSGIVSFRREKFIPKGGPDGGTGGRGGSIVLRANRQLSTLMDFRYKRTYRAPDGENGMGANKTGRKGEDIILYVPCGTTIRESATSDIIADLVDDGDEVVIAKGGKPGRGNAEFATSTDQAPRRAEPGLPGEERTIDLELKLLADVGLVGFPNAGKSTLISRISAARPKIADYPFTTLIPNLGIVRYAEYQSFVVADMPGLIEGAHTGKGLGIQFLRHIERTSVLVFLIDCSVEDPKEEYRTLLHELEMYHAEMLEKPRIIALSKTDLLDADALAGLRKLKFDRRSPCFFSSVSGDGLKELTDAMWKALKR
jgi:GTPase